MQDTITYINKPNGTLKFLEFKFEFLSMNDYTATYLEVYFKDD